jgi:hypothetical protein
MRLGGGARGGGGPIGELGLSRPVHRGGDDGRRGVRVRQLEQEWKQRKKRKR